MATRPFIYVAAASNRQHRVADATHAGLVDDDQSYAFPVQAIAHVVQSVRTGRRVTAR
jgi:hypothetical protein